MRKRNDLDANSFLKRWYNSGEKKYNDGEKKQSNQFVLQFDWYWGFGEIIPKI